MSNKALVAALEGLITEDEGTLEASSKGAGENNAAADDSNKPIVDETNTIVDPTKLPGGELKDLVQEATTALEQFYEGGGEVSSQAEQIAAYLEENDAQHQVMREDIKDIRNHLEAVSGSMEMLAQITSLESIDDHSLAIANVSLEHLGRHLPYATPSLESIDGKVTDASLEGLVDFLKAGANRIKNWFKDLFDAMNLNGLRERRGLATYEARVRRLLDIIKRLPSELGRPVDNILYRDTYVWGLYQDGKPIPFNADTLTAALKQAGEIGMLGLNENQKEHLANIKVINSTLPGLLMNIADDGGEKATRGMVERLEIPKTLNAKINYGNEFAGGITYREGNYRPSIRVASWAQPMVEMVERDRVAYQFRRTGRIDIQTLDIAAIEKILDSVMGIINARHDRFDSYWGELVEEYQDSVSAYNKTLGLAQGTNHSELTSEVWKAIDLASYVMMQLFNVVIYEAGSLSVPFMRLIDSVLYVCEEQLNKYVRVNR